MATTAIALTLVTSCSGNDDKDAGKKPSAPATITLKTVKDIPGVTMIDGDEPWPIYSTAKIVQVDAGAGGRTIDVNYEAGPDLCSGFAGYAVDTTAKTAAVTVVMGRKATCTGKGKERTTVLPIAAGLGGAKPTISKYSVKAIPIGK